MILVSMMHSKCNGETQYQEAFYNLSF